MNNLSEFLHHHFDYYYKKYSFSKYPSEIYLESIKSFSMLNKENDYVDLALRWKWGHSVDKINIPESHIKLIEEVKSKWVDFISSGSYNSSFDTFTWWSKRLAKNTYKRYITVSFITHLIHHHEIPIIDQHNFRAMNYLENNFTLENSKKSPSNWEDILKLKVFINNLKASFPNRSKEDIDKFLMMFGKSLK